MAKAEGRIGVRGTRWTLAYWSAAALAVLTPLVAMQFTDAVKWTPLDFAFIGALLGGVGLGMELAVRRSGSVAYRLAAAVALMTVLLLVWINGAVGIIGGEQQHANVLYVGVPAVALAGALVARFRPLGMAVAMAAAGLAQILVPAMASMLWADVQAMAWTPKVLGLNSGFVAMWALAAWLFRKAAARRGVAG